jgi:hypothetical protein
MLNRFEIVIELINQRDAIGNIDFHNVFIGNLVEILN